MRTLLIAALVAGGGLVGAYVLAPEAEAATPPPEGGGSSPAPAPSGSWPGRYFTLAELTVSSTAARKGLSNQPDAPARERLANLTTKLLDPIREGLGSAVTVNSGYRSPAVNEAIGGSTTSQHMTGEAADIQFGRNIDSRTRARQVLAVIRSKRLVYDQLIWYDHKPHVHVSLKVSGRQRQQVLRAKPDGSYVAEMP